MNKMNARVKKRSQGRLAKNAELLILCVPAIVCYALFYYAPMFGLVLAFKDYKLSKGIWGSQWVGLSNFRYLIESVVLQRIVTNTLAYSFTFIVTGLIINVAVALLLHEISHSRGLLKYYQTTMIFPKFLSWVIVGYITYALFNPNLGVLNSILNSLGIEFVDVYQESRYWPGILVFVNLWKSVGIGSMIYFAALIAIDKSLYEAACIDGAGRIKQIIHISIPGILPLMTIMSIMAMGGIFSGDFGLFYQIPRNQSLLYSTTDIIDTYIFRSLQNSKYSAASAVGMVQSVVGLIMVLLANAVVKRINPQNRMF